MPGKGKTALGECAVCDAGKGAKYRCPACRTPYCSLACFKTHKAGDGCATAAKMAAATGKRKRAAKTETGGKKSKSVKLVGKAQLARLKEDARVRDAIKSTQLQEVSGNRGVAAALSQPQGTARAGPGLPGVWEQSAHGVGRRRDVRHGRSPFRVE